MTNRLLLVAIFAIIVGSVVAQDVRIAADTMFLSNGAVFVKGQKVKLGYGSNGGKGFEFIYLSPYSIAGPQKLGSNWANMEMVVKKFEIFSSKKTGKKFYLVLGGGNLSPYWCDVIAAIEQKELLVTGVNDKKDSGKTSVADELKKLKELFDSGAISKEEYEAAKKKVLGQ